MGCPRWPGRWLSVGRRGDYHRPRIGARRKFNSKEVCPECGMMGFHRVTCERYLHHRSNDADTGRRDWSSGCVDDDEV